jgi:hypothetical protein
LENIKSIKGAIRILIGYLKSIKDNEKLFKLYQYYNMNKDLLFFMLDDAIKEKNSLLKIEKYQELEKFCINKNLKEYINIMKDQVKLLNIQSSLDEHDNNVSDMGKNQLFKDYPRYDLFGKTLNETLQCKIINK